MRASTAVIRQAITCLVVLGLMTAWTNRLRAQIAISELYRPAQSSTLPVSETLAGAQDADPARIDAGVAGDFLQDGKVPATSRPPTSFSPQQGPQTLLLFENGRLKITGNFQAGINAISEGNVFWNLAEFAAPTVDFDSDPEWLEGYLKPGVSFERTTGSGPTTYGKISAVMSGTLGIDAFDEGDTGRTTIEEGYLGFQNQPNPGKSLWDISFGPRELKLGTGMLVANGAQNGFERGALKFGPRKAWGFAAFGRLKRKLLTTTLFYLDANEMRSNDTGTTLSGIDLRIDRESKDYFGTTIIYVPTSDSPYPKASPIGSGPPTILPGAREGLNAVNSYFRFVPLQQYPDVFVTTDFAYEYNDRIDLEAWGGRIQAGRTLNNLKWKPTLLYSFQTFSGDDPSTTKLERFDPLAYEGSPSSWATGSKSALVFINSNVNSHQLALSITPTIRDTVTLRYAHIRANELFSPLQFGQATRLQLEDGLSTVITGVADEHVSDDFFIEHNRVINANTFLNTGFSVSVPGRGIELVAPGNTPIWPGGFMNLVVNY